MAHFFRAAHGTVSRVTVGRHVSFASPLLVVNGQVPRTRFSLAAIVTELVKPNPGARLLTLAVHDEEEGNDGCSRPGMALWGSPWWWCRCY